MSTEHAERLHGQIEVTKSDGTTDVHDVWAEPVDLAAMVLSAADTDDFQRLVITLERGVPDEVEMLPRADDPRAEDDDG